MLNVSSVVFRYANIWTIVSIGKNWFSFHLYVIRQHFTFWCKKPIKLKTKQTFLEFKLISPKQIFDIWMRFFNFFLFLWFCFYLFLYTVLYLLYCDLIYLQEFFHLWIAFLEVLPIELFFQVIASGEANAKFN